MLRRPLNFARLLTAIALLGVCAAGLSAAAGASSKLTAGPTGFVRPLGSTSPLVTRTAPALLQYWGGAVMRKSSAYAIFWLPSGSGLSFGASNSGYEAALSQFLGDVAHDSGTASNVFGLDTQYYDTLSGGQTHIAYNATFGGSAVATDPLPSKQCSDSGTSFCVTDGQLQAEVRSVVAANGWPQDTSHVYFIFTPSGLGSCASGSSSTCAYSSYCAYHGAFSNGGNSTILYGNMPWVYGKSGCDVGQYPNGGQADPTINVLSHEFNEAITDPVPNWGWVDASGAETGDKCAWTFGALSGSKGTQYDQTINGHHYLLQEEFDNASDACQLSPVTVTPAPVIASFSPAKGKVGSSVTIAGSGFTGTSAVTFNGTAAKSFAVSSAGSITVTVPTGATSGKVSVTTPGGMATSSTSFTVSP